MASPSCQTQDERQILGAFVAHFAGGKGDSCLWKILSASCDDVGNQHLSNAPRKKMEEDWSEVYH